MRTTLLVGMAAALMAAATAVTAGGPAALAAAPVTSATPATPATSATSAGVAEVVAVRPAVVTDVATASGVYDLNRSWSACESPDATLLYVGDHQLSSHVYAASRSGVYRELPKGRAWPLSVDGSRPDRHGCAIADFDGNGLWDIANSTGRSLANFVKPDTLDNELWLQQPGGGFTDVGTQAGMGDPCTRGRQMATADWTSADGTGGPDGLPDLFVGAMDPREVVDVCSDDPASQAGHLFANRGVDPFGQWLGFVRVQDTGATQAGVRCAEAHDIDGDGVADLVACQKPGRPPLAYLDRGGRLVEQPAEVTGLSVPVADLQEQDVTGDGLVDAVQARRDSCGYQRGDGQGHFGRYVVTSTVANGFGRSVAAGATAAGTAVYCQVTAPQANPDDHVAVRTVGPRRLVSWENHDVVADSGVSDEVYAIHPRGPQGTVEFLVLNGESDLSVGPVQLIRVTR